MASGDGNDEGFSLGRMIGELGSDIKGLRLDLNSRHVENQARLNSIELKQREFEEKLAKLWLFRGRLLIVGGLFLVGVHFVAEAIVGPTLHYLGITQ